MKLKEMIKNMSKKTKITVSILLTVIFIAGGTALIIHCKQEAEHQRKLAARFDFVAEKMYPYFSERFERLRFVINNERNLMKQAHETDPINTEQIFLYYYNKYRVGYQLGWVGIYDSVFASLNFRILASRPDRRKKESNAFIILSDVAENYPELHGKRSNYNEYMSYSLELINKIDECFVTLRKYDKGQSYDPSTNFLGPELDLENF